jgi:hypothetical protein
MQKALLTMIALGLLGAPSARAAEPSLFELYKAACFDTHADPEKALAALGPGWSDGPETLVGGVHKTKRAGGARWDLQLLETVEPKGERGAPFAIQMRICTVTTSSITTGIYAAVRGLMGAEPTERGEVGPIWEYYDEPGGRRFVRRQDNAAASDLVASQPLRIVTSREGPTASGAAFTEISRLEP